MKPLFQEYRGLRREVYILFLGRIVTNMGAMIWPMLTMILSVKMHMDASAIASIFLLFSVVSLPVNLIGGRLADRFSKKYLIIWCDLVSIASYIACAFLPLNTTALGFLFVASLFQNIEGPAYDALMADLTAGGDRERGFSLSYLGSNLGLVLAPTIGGLLFQNYLWLAFLISGLAIASSTILIFFKVKDIHREQETGEKKNTYEQDAPDASTFEVLHHSPVILLYIACTALGSLVYSQFNYLIPMDLAARYGSHGSVLFGTMTSLNCIIVVLFTPLLTRKSANIRDTARLFLGESLILAGELIFCLLQGLPFFCYAAMAVFTVGEIMNTISGTPWMTRRIPASHRGRIMSVIGVFCSLFQGFSQKAIGWLYDASGSRPAWIAVFAAGGLELALLLLLRSRDQKIYPELYRQ